MTDRCGRTFIYTITCADYDFPTVYMVCGLLLVSIEPCKRKNTKVWWKFTEQYFWKCLIVDWDDGSMWRNFLQRHHLRRLWFSNDLQDLWFIYFCQLNLVSVQINTSIKIRRTELLEMLNCWLRWRIDVEELASMSPLKPVRGQYRLFCLKLNRLTRICWFHSPRCYLWDGDFTTIEKARRLRTVTQNFCFF